MNIPFETKSLVRTIIDYLSFTWVPVDVASFRKAVRVGVTDDANKQPELWAPEWWDRTKPLDNPQDQAPKIRAARNRWIENEIKRRYKTKYAMDLKKMDLYLTRELMGFFDSISPMFGDTVEMIERDRGVFGYKQSWMIMIDGVQMGIAATGASNGGCYMSFTGQGCGYINMKAMHSKLVAISAKITRVDPAYDDFQGSHSVFQARDYYKAGMFTNGGKPPKYRYIEGGHLDMSRKVSGQNPLVPSDGCSFYVGSRDGGKMLRVYEKGKQLMSNGKDVNPEYSNWVRWELELHNDRREIPLDILLRPSEYMAAAYPALAFLASEETADETCRIKCTQKTVKLSINQLCHFAKQSYGAVINVMRHSMDMTDSQIVNLLISENDSAVPKRLKRALGGAVMMT